MSLNLKPLLAVKVEEVEDLASEVAERIHSVCQVNKRVKVDIVFRNSLVALVIS